MNMDHQNTEDWPEAFPVLIVGGSLVGLSAAMFLAAHGVDCMVVERHSGSAPHPRARGFTQRTVEMFDAAGLRDLPAIPPSSGNPTEIPQSAGRVRRVRAESMTGTWIEEIDWTPKGAVEPTATPSAPRSPHTGIALAQDQLEPLLRQQALDLGAVLCLGTELVRFEDRADGIIAWLKDAQGVVRTVHADYLVGCDGNQSVVRDALGIARQGIGVIQTMRSVLFHADLERYRRGVGQFEIEQPGLDAFLAGYGDGRWALMFRDDVERDEAALADAIQRAVGTPVAARILAVGRWELTGLIADRFRKGRVFLAGDAAHTLPPTRGGYGANTGIADAFNLAWKLAAVLSGRSEEALLDSYEQERRPIAWLRFQQTFARPDYARYADSALRATPLLDPVAIELGELYQSSIVAQGTDLPPVRLPEEWRGQPGTRAPHRVVTRDGVSMSTLDFYGVGWVLVSSSDTWCDAAARIEDRTGVLVGSVNLRATLGQGDGALVEQDLGIGAQGASIVRPDGVVAWRSTQGHGSVDELELVMKTVALPSGSRA
jgi:putative polyketide hydroxylase